MNKAIYPGTFDPVTNGHIDIIKRASGIFDEVVVAVARHSSKNPLFTLPERLALVEKSAQGITNVKVKSFDGLVVKFVRAQKARVIIRGLRMISDFEYELQMALTNRSLAQDVETIFLMPHQDYSFISSRLIKEAMALGADLHKFLPRPVVSALKGALKNCK